MMMILFENGLFKEALIAKEAIWDAFGMDAKTKRCSTGLFKFNKGLDGYEIQIVKGYKNKVILTDKDIFPYGSDSKEDDWVFGFATEQKQFIISLARLRANSDNPSNALKIAKERYKKRIRFIVVHELGHWLVKNQRHYKKFIYNNPKTKHKTDLGCIVLTIGV